GTKAHSKAAYLTPEQWLRTIELAQGPERLALGLGVLAGLRQAEIRYLRIEDVDVFNRRIRIRRRSYPEPWKPKYDKERDVPIAPQLWEMLQQHSAGEVYWFEKRPGKRVGVTTLREWIEAALERAGLRYGR